MSDTGKKVRDAMTKIKELNAGEKPDIDAVADQVADLFPDPKKIADALKLSDGTDGKRGDSVRGGGLG